LLPGLANVTLAGQQAMSTLICFALKEAAAPFHKIAAAFLVGDKVTSL
jgi:hypothetical protein